MKKNLFAFFCLLLTFIGAAAVKGQTTAETAVKSYSKAALPRAGQPGRIARVTDEERGLYIDTGTDWVSLAGREIDVRLFGAAGDGKTDDTAAIQAAIDFAKLGRRGGTVFFPKPSVYYKINGQLNLESAVSITLQGESRPTGFAGGTNGALVFTGLGVLPTTAVTRNNADQSRAVTQPSLINVRSSTGVSIRNLRILYSNASFTGDVIDASAVPTASSTVNKPVLSAGDTQQLEISGCEIRSTSATIFGARYGINLYRAIIVDIRENQFSWLKVGIVGKVSGGYSNVVNIESNLFLRVKEVGIRNGEQTWNIRGNTFEPTMDNQFGAYDETLVSFGPIVFENNWCGDAVAAGKPWILFKGLHLTVRNNIFATPDSLFVNQAAIVVDVAGSSVDSVSLERNLYTGFSKAVKITTTGAPGSLRKFSSFGDIWLGGTTNYLQNDIGLNLLEQEIIGSDISNQLTRTSFGKTNEVPLRVGQIHNLADISNRAGASIGDVTNLGGGTTYGTLGIVGYTRDDGVHSPVEIWTGAAVPERRLSVGQEIRSYGAIVTPALKVSTGNENGSYISGIYAAAAALDFPSINSGASSQLTITVNNITADDKNTVVVTPAGLPEPGIVWMGAVTSANTVTIRLTNAGGAAINPVSRSWRVEVTRHQ